MQPSVGLTPLTSSSAQSLFNSLHFNQSQQYIPPIDILSNLGQSLNVLEKCTVIHCNIGLVQ